LQWNGSAKEGKGTGGFEQKREVAFKSETFHFYKNIDFADGEKGEKTPDNGEQVPKTGAPDDVLQISRSQDDLSEVKGRAEKKSGE